MTGGWQALVLGMLQGLAASTVFLLALFIGFCVLLAYPKLRRGGAGARVVRSLDERLGGSTPLFGPDVPRGPVDQLHTPELEEVAARKEG